MNAHLNLFRFYSESNEAHYLENNLSRALAICLQQEPFFLAEFVRAITNQEQFDQLYGSNTADAVLKIDLQKDTAQLEAEQFRKVIGVALTTNKELSPFESTAAAASEKREITDLVITINDVAILVEVKRTAEDARQQRDRQLAVFGNKPGLAVDRTELSWTKVLSLAEMVRQSQRMHGQPSVWMNHFLQLVEGRFAHWLSPLPLNKMVLQGDSFDVNQHRAMQRVQLALNEVQNLLGNDFAPLAYSDRTGIQLPFDWASELVISLVRQGDGKADVWFQVWPGNTKSQGYSLFAKPQDWALRTSLDVADESLPLEVSKHVKLCHFNRYITNIEYTADQEVFPLYTRQNFEQSGKWNREDWPALEQWLDSHFEPEFNWRENCGWKHHWLQTDRSYLTLSLGYEAIVSVPFSTVQQWDDGGDTPTALATKIAQVAEAFRRLVEA